MNIFTEVLVEPCLPPAMAAQRYRFGGLRSAFDSARAARSLGCQDCDLVVDWLTAGAARGGSAAQCAQ